MKSLHQPSLLLKKPFILLLGITVCILSLSHCVAGDKKQQASETEASNQFAGSKACIACHKQISEQHVGTAHHATSLLASKENILGSFKEGKNKFAFSGNTSVFMEKTDSGLYQVQYTNGQRLKAGKFDLVVGSGRKGQSYLSWAPNNTLSQLPITYFTPAAAWSNSPGYRPHYPAYNRPITSRCLECHSTSFTTTSSPPANRDQFDRGRIILGVECEKCHGPAAQHVTYHNVNKNSPAKFVVNPGKLPKERLLDLCALCHGGALKKTKPSFSFSAGDSLSNYFSLQEAMFNADNIDVHGNQAGLLYLSRCFQQSGNLTCLNCHNSHENEANRLDIFSQRCMSCHSESHGKSCPMTATLGQSIQQNCIDCHMPRQPSHAIAVYLEGTATPTPALLRTHFIKSYPEETKKFMAAVRSKVSPIKTK